VLRSISVYRHAAVITPVARWALIARGTAYSNRFPVPSGCGLPHPNARSASTLVVSRPAQRSLAITACRLAESPIATRLSRRLRRFRYLHRRSDSYRLERPRCRARISLAEDQHLTRFTAHNRSDPLELAHPTGKPPGTHQGTPSEAQRGIAGADPRAGRADCFQWSRPRRRSSPTRSLPSCRDCDEIGAPCFSIPAIRWPHVEFLFGATIVRRKQPP
jgi:hypothetical protein